LSNTFHNKDITINNYEIKVYKNYHKPTKNSTKTKYTKREYTKRKLNKNSIKKIY